MNQLDFENLSEDEKRYDEMLLSILQREGKIEPFLDTVFKFLHRRTDFFLVMETPDQSFGFPPNVAKKIVQNTFNKYDSIPKEILKERILQTNQLPKSKEIAVSKKTTEIKKSISTSTKTVTTDTNDFQTKQNDLNVPDNKSIIQNETEEALKKQQEEFQKNPSSYNGAIRENYEWTQTIKDIDVRVKIDSRIKSSKDVIVKIERSSLKVSFKENNDIKFLINDNLAWKIKPDECTWSLFPGDHIHINLEKVDERWWENLLEHESKLDLKYMNPEKPMSELDDESQAKIKQMMFDQHQKRLGLPTSEEQKNIDILAKAWNQENSPLKGTPFDPSILQNH